MPTLQEEIAEMDKILERRGDIQRAINDLEHEARKKGDSVRERIKAGETLGDRVKDFVIVHFGFAAPEIEIVYQDISCRMRAAIGEFVLMIEREQMPGFHYLMPRAGEFTPPDVVIETMSLGVLVRDSLETWLETRVCAFPTEKHAVYHDPVTRRGMELVASHLGEHSLVNFWYRSREKVTDGREEMAAASVLIGDQEIMKWAMVQTPWDALTQPTRRLRTVLKMAKMLGRPANELPAFADTVTTRRLLIRASLERNMTEYEHFLRQIGDYVADPKNRDEPEDFKDWLRTRREEIQKLYGEALDYGMADDEVVRSAAEILTSPSK